MAFLQPHPLPAAEAIHGQAHSVSVSPGTRSVLITGAADGIGRGIATTFARAGDRVALLDYDADKLARTTEAFQATGAEALAIQMDVRDAAAVRAAVDEVVGRDGRLDVTVSNAGIY